MADIAHSFDNELMSGDWLMEGGLLATDDGLKAAILHSLFSDARAQDGDLEDPGADPRGWWGDALGPEGDVYGSRRWLIAREKQTPATLARVRKYDLQALNWLVTDGIASAVEIEAAWAGPGQLRERIALTLADGQKSEYQFQLPWSS